MSTYAIDINDDILMTKVSEILNDALNRQLNRKCSATADVIAEACREIVYSHKDEIIEKVVDRAAKEIARRGLVKLLEREDKNGLI